jgi:hypothetical protein
MSSCQGGANPLDCGIATRGEWKVVAYTWVKRAPSSCTEIALQQRLPVSSPVS